MTEAKNEFGVTCNFKGKLTYVKEYGSKSGLMAFGSLFVPNKGESVSIQLKGFEETATFMIENQDNYVKGWGILRNQYGDRNKGKNEIVIRSIELINVKKSEKTHRAKDDVKDEVEIENIEKGTSKPVVDITEDDLPF